MLGIKISDNALDRLPDRIVARVSRPGRTTAAFKEFGGWNSSTCRRYAC
ncbi:MAG: hypothetical protein ACRDRH_17570 [Pseudonocardia sp.]